ncbi:anthranilate synthase component II [Clostridium sp. B9]|uniref:anthranilate synthase component II n=1 Tax=Clostridium sp. B9 TaxID=3423224 RepID=UPI003D2F0A53
MFLIIDNYDSFVFNLVRYFKEIEEDIVIKRNDKITIDKIRELKPEGILISPGPKAPWDMKECLDIIDEFKGKIPILGVCLGHQCIGYSFGSKVKKGEYPVHGKVSKITHDGKGVFKGLKNDINVTRYHSLIIDKENLSEDLEITALSEDGVIMGVRHKKYKIEGVQFHPEAVLTEYGHEMLKNFVELSRN